MDSQAGRRFEVRVEGVYFDAAHFATYGGECEPLHGHSYQVAAEIAGPLTDQAWVVNFIELKAILRGLSRELDHRFMLQLDSRLLHIDDAGESWRIETPGDRSFSFPKTDVAALPIDNTTAERLAEWFGDRLARSLAERGVTNLESITVEVWEGPGQRASHRQHGLPVE